MRILQIEEIQKELNRPELKMTELAKIIGCHRQTLYNLKAGADTVNYKTLVRLSEYFTKGRE
jgi:plasmid maintenance system antidote protein VapI